MPDQKQQQVRLGRDLRFSDGRRLSWRVGGRGGAEVDNDPGEGGEDDPVPLRGRYARAECWPGEGRDMTVWLQAGPLGRFPVRIPAPVRVRDLVSRVERFYATPVSASERERIERSGAISQWNPLHVRGREDFDRLVRTYRDLQGDHLFINSFSWPRNTAEYDS